GAFEGFVDSNVRRNSHGDRSGPETAVGGGNGATVVSHGAWATKRNAVRLPLFHDLGFLARGYLKGFDAAGPQDIAILQPPLAYRGHRRWGANVHVGRRDAKAFIAFHVKSYRAAVKPGNQTGFVAVHVQGAVFGKNQLDGSRAEGHGTLGVGAQAVADI